MIHSILMATSLMMMAGAGDAQTEFLADAEGVALGGYDAVAYHTTNSAVRGNKSFALEQNGQMFYFSNGENQKAFKDNPKKYAPQYGGNCAFAMAMKSAKVPSDPQTFKIRDGKLYLFFNDFYDGQPFNTVIPWNADEKEMLTKADANWKDVKSR